MVISKGGTNKPNKDWKAAFTKEDTSQLQIWAESGQVFKAIL